MYVFMAVRLSWRHLRFAEIRQGLYESNRSTFNWLRHSVLLWWLLEVISHRSKSTIIISYSDLVESTSCLHSFFTLGPL